MKDNTVILLIVGGFVLLFWAFSKGYISASPTGIGTNPQTGQPYGVIQTPQPTSNYSGYLAATTAPGVSSALNGALSGIGSGLNHLFSGWLGSQGNATPVVNQGPLQPASGAPSQGAQPSGPTPTGFFSGASSNPVMSASAAVGPAIAPDISYGATTGAAFDYFGLASSNAPDMSYALNDPALGDTGVYAS